MMCLHEPRRKDAEPGLARRSFCKQAHTGTRTECTRVPPGVVMKQLELCCPCTGVDGGD
jgi:hypothetical protein